MVSKGLLGYGYSAPFSASFERPVLCSMADLEKVSIVLVELLYLVVLVKVKIKVLSMKF